MSPRFDGLGRDGAPVRLGVLGGTFDPVHFGHLACAQQALEALDLAGVVFMPAGSPAFKQDRRLLSGRQRLELCRLAVQGNLAFDVSALEVDRPGVTYAVDTLQQLRDFYPSNVALYFILGADAALTLPRWHESERLAGLATFAVAARPGYVLGRAERASLAERGFTVEAFPVTELDISSTDLRNRAAAHRSLRYLTPDAVAERIRQRGWYQEEGSSL